MSYDYHTEKPKVFMEENQELFLSILDRATRLTREAGAASMEAIICGLSGDTWIMLACVDRLVEIGALREVPNPHSRTGQHRLFIGAAQ